ncbi:type I restriction endonuclease [Helicobacter pylori]|uniref:type I site-specific deoxyribonuclease n=8 Tax=Helicobacter pylori TaxID=210 RepID=O25211_HELPY|nr:type I restriction endonuclease subunit R [Helicobacter pylori]AAD07526.1 type I restriction enzyme R protein (hsdR) [Helicobacter pylori 26695]AFV41681.1 type I restriction enzyme R protein [Helicobacter pylori 26695]AFV43275.1 type I restriction enzyme R protein [Helicobacter pylori Rif1]AFV44868.1 type I restriction enzyme R protein [Helicobacter pylori Rif2]AJF08755.1 restriction endonuclease subunit R [Helicobacter pylori 26695-1]
MPYNEITRVQIPALMHLAKLGYDFIPTNSKENKPNLDTATNILTNSFTKSFERLNPTKNAQETLAEMKKRLNCDDLGKSFYEYLLKSENQIIDFDNPNNNLYEMMTELPYKSFRPDTTLFINGLPLVNIEVKQPYAKKGIKEERDRHIKRYENPENKVFYNLAQIWLFSDNLPYDENKPDQGAFYSASYSPIFQRFVEAHRLDITPPPPQKNDQNHQNDQNHRSLEEIQKSVLNEFNLKDTDTPKSPKDTPTNSLLTSFCSPKRLCFILKYGISFLKEKSEFKKHVWRYAQMFASLNVLKELQKHYGTNQNLKDPLKGIIWHTQGSGKTALTYHLTKLIRDFFSRSNLNKKTKFYFIVDRLDLLEQAKNEFLKRGLCVHEAENKEDLSQKLKSSSVFEGSQGNDEIIVVNIQKFKAPNEEKSPNEDPSNSAPKEIISKTELQESIQNSRNLQRVFIIDEAHRSYDPKGCFYANLIECDKTAIKIALTGTPLLEDNAQDKATKNTFGNYLHTYSYTESIKDRHTLKLQLESIETSYKEKLQEIYRLLQESITIEDTEVKKETIFNDEKYINAMLYYIIRDLLDFRRLNDNERLKAMVVCFSSKQARLADCLFNEVQEKVLQENPNLRILNKLKSSLILHDEQEVKEKVHSFKHEDTDIVFVFNMLLTGFDLPSLKRLYIHRELKDHNLLQALARVNRSYKNMSFGYLIDFVGIQENFDKTTDDYLKELNRFNQSGANSDSHIKDMFADRKTLEEDIKNAYDDLFDYPIDDIEGMTSAIVSMSAMNELVKVSRAINTLKERYNLIRTSNDKKILSLKEKIDIEKIHKISSMLHQKAKHLHALKNINEPKNPNDLMILEDLIALLDFKIEFKERKELRFKEQEEITTKQKQAKEILEKIPDQQDKEIQKFYKDFSKLLQTPTTSQNFEEISHSYDAIISQLKQHKEQTTHLLNKYDNDLSYAITNKRLHKHLMEQNISNSAGIFTLLSALKKAIDARIFKRQEILNEEYYLKNAIKAELNNAFKKDPSLKDLEKEKELIIQTLFNELTQNHHQGNPHA